MKHLIVGDIAGELDALKKIHEAAKSKYGEVKIISVGDINDRGPDSKGCIQYIMDHGDSCDSNHGQMMLTFLKPDVGTAYEDASFIMNGGVKTIASYDATLLGKYTDLFKRTEEYWMHGDNRPPKSMYEGLRTDLLAMMPDEHVEYLDSRPMFIEINDTIMTHAPINPTVSWEKLTTDPEWKHESIGLLWNRGRPRRIEGKFQIYGHNAYSCVTDHTDEHGVYARGIDTSKVKILTGYLLEENEYFRCSYSGILYKDEGQT